MHPWLLMKELANNVLNEMYILLNMLNWTSRCGYVRMLIHNTWVCSAVLKPCQSLGRKNGQEVRFMQIIQNSWNSVPLRPLRHKELCLIYHYKISGATNFSLIPERLLLNISARKQEFNLFQLAKNDCKTKNLPTWQDWILCDYHLI